MLEILNNFDTQLFLFFNVSLANPGFDVLMPFVTNKWTWAPIWLATIIALIWKGGKKGPWIVLVVIVTVAITDLTAHRVLKKSIRRVRPCNAIEQVHLTVRKSKSYSMPSNHAANFFALATLFSFFFRRYKKVFFGLAALVAFSRVSVGVHYPFDILAGALLGYLVARLMLCVYKKYIVPKYIHSK